MLQSSLSGRTFQVLKTSRDNHVTQVSGCCCGCRVPRRESGWLSVRRDEMEGGSVRSSRDVAVQVMIRLQTEF